MFNEEANLFLEEYKEDLNKAVTHLADELGQVRAGRANPRIIEKIVVDYYGTPTPINQMANISVPEARLVTISVWDISQTKAIIKAINDAQLGLSPSDDGKIIRLNFPQLTEERRREIVKEVNKLTENSRITCRNLRRDVLDEFKKMKKNNTLTEDELERIEKEVQKILDASMGKIDVLASQKEKEVMEV